MSKIHKFKGPDGKIHKVRGDSKEGALKFLQEHLSSQAEKGPKGEVSGAGQTFMEQFAQGAALDAYDTAKSKITGKSQEQVEADLQASHEASPIAGWSGYILGTLAGGGALGGAAKLGLKGAAKMAPGAAKAVQAATKAAPKATAVGTGAAAGLGYGTAHRALNDREITGAGAAFDALTGGIGGRIGHSLSSKTKGPTKSALYDAEKGAYKKLKDAGVELDAKSFVTAARKNIDDAVKEQDVIKADNLTSTKEIKDLLDAIESTNKLTVNNLRELRIQASKGKGFEDKAVGKKFGKFVEDTADKIVDPVKAPKGFGDDLRSALAMTSRRKTANVIMKKAYKAKTKASRQNLLKDDKFVAAMGNLDDAGRKAIESWVNQGFTARVIEMLSNAGLIGTGTAIGHMFVNPMTGIPQAGALLAAKPLNKAGQARRLKKLEQSLRSGPTDIKPIGPTPGLLSAGILGNFGE